MSTVTVVTCDFCPKVKGKNDIWWSASWSGVGLLGTFLFSHYKAPGKAETSLDACSFGCVQMALARFMDHGDF